ncbi:helix-turn-helix domain-containing protein [Heyndrickxia sp. NPDC080065]|uniref:helix-turn-helix domain-containing protein n=1 Tax=Heyndrickxia sp. NPDC080065 TaxID=3390568 RepID=UPI003D06B11E
MIDRDLPLKKEISNNIKRLMKRNNWTQLKTSEMSGISKSTLSDYVNYKTLINPRNVEKLSKAFNVPKSEIDPSFKSKDSQLPELNSKDERDIQKELQKMIDGLSGKNGYAAFDGQDINDIDEEDRELLIASLENSLRLAKRIAKQKFTPKKYRN